MKTIKVKTLAKAINEVKPIKDFNVTITIGITAVDESDVENQISTILAELNSIIEYENYDMEIKEVGEYK